MTEETRKLDRVYDKIDNINDTVNNLKIDMMELKTSFREHCRTTENGKKPRWYQLLLFILVGALLSQGPAGISAIMKLIK